jgi:hypothetical protein
VPDYIDEQLHKNQKAGPGMLAHAKRFVGFAFTEQKEDEQAVDGDETAIMNYKKGNRKELADIRYWGLDFSEHNFEDIVKANDEIFGPVEQNDIKRVPAECDNTVYGQHIRKHQSDKRDVSPATARNCACAETSKLFFEWSHLTAFDSCLIISLPAGF